MLHNASYTFAYFFWILRTIKMKFVQVLVCCRKNSFSMFLAECWRLETSSGPFYDFIKKTIQQDLAIFNGWHIFNCPLFTFSKIEILESWHIWLLINWNRFLNSKGPGIYPQPSKLFKRLLKIITLAYIYHLAKFGDFMSCGSKDIFKNVPCLMY